MTDRCVDDERGVSEVLGYIVVFSLVITAIGFVLVSGIPALENVRDAEQASNAERALDVVADNMASVYERNSPSRSTEIDLGESELYYGSNVTVRVTVDDGTTTETVSYQLRPMVLQISEDTKLVYEAGAVFRDQGDSGLVLREPPLLFDDRVHVPIVQTTSPALESAGSTTILLRGQSTNRSVLVSDTDDSYNQITFEVASPRYEIWEQYLDSKNGLSCSVDDSVKTVSCTSNDPEIVYVTLQQIELSIIL